MYETTNRPLASLVISAIVAVIALGLFATKPETFTERFCEPAPPTVTQRAVQPLLVKPAQTLADKTPIWQFAPLSASELEAIQLLGTESLKEQVRSLPTLQAHEQLSATAKVKREASLLISAVPAREMLVIRRDEALFNQYRRATTGLEIGDEAHATLWRLRTIARERLRINPALGT